MTNETLLFVDDEPNVLKSMERQLRKRFTVLTAAGGDSALQLLKEQGPVAVIISDMRMPGMDGIQLLAKVKDLYPDIVRIMLTGNADQETAIEAVNTGHIFRFLTKPCSTSVLVTSLALALRQHRLMTAEKELLKQTLKGSRKVLSELLSLANASAFSSGYRIKGPVIEMSTVLNLPHLWRYEIAALMSQVGCITLPDEILKKAHGGEVLSEEELETFTNHPKVGAKLVGQIPRLEQVAAMIALQLRRFDEYGEEEEEIAEEVLLGAQILKAVIDYDLLRHQGNSHGEALKTLRGDSGAYNPVVLDLFTKINLEAQKTKIISIHFKDIRPGMVAEDDVFAQNSALIIPKGQEITWPVIKGLSNFIKHIGIQEPFRVRISVDNEDEADDDTHMT